MKTKKDVDWKLAFYRLLNFYTSTKVPHCPMDYLFQLDVEGGCNKTHKCQDCWAIWWREHKDD